MFYLERQCRFIIMDSESYITGENVDYRFTIDLGMSSIEHDERDVLLYVDNNYILLSPYKFPRWFRKNYKEFYLTYLKLKEAGTLKYHQRKASYIILPEVEKELLEKLNGLL